ncbi:MAG: HAMP domain-containing sensor histidine kinase [Clostridiaceae bacterium]
MKLEKLKTQLRRLFRFRSLTMRIWTTFTAVILIIICSTSFLYLVAYRKVNENAKIEDLKVAHDILLNSDNYTPPSRFDELKNLKGSDNFIAIVSDSSIAISELSKIKDVHPPDSGNGTFDRIDLKKWMLSYVGKSSVYESVYTGTYKNQKFIFIISSIETQGADKAYLVSFTPDFQDYNLLYTVIVIGLVFIAIGFLTAKVVANYISKPLKVLEKHTERIAHKDWKEPIIIKNEDEIGRLAEAMNRMQKQLKTADQEEKMFLQSISHDLKTPVMVIMSHADAIIDGVYIESVEKTAEIIRDEAVGLQKKIKQLLYLNTLDYVLGNTAEKSKFALSELLIHIISRLEVVNSKIEWILDIDPVNIEGNKEKMKVAIENILENGLRYAKTKICVTLREENSFAVLEIYNDGPNIPEESIGHIFENLYKDKTGNFGLGLAISKKIIDFHDGEIEAANRENGVSFIIKYPIQK